MNTQYLELMLGAVKFGNGDSDRHGLTLFGIAMAMHAKAVLELGVRNGGTTLPLLCAVKEFGGMLHSVDLQRQLGEAPEEFRAHWQFFESDAIAWLEDRVQQKAQYDIVYIDDWHSYPHVKRELELIDQLVTPSSVILLHDLMYSNAQPHYRGDPDCQDPQWQGGGPYRAVAELDPDRWEWSTVPVNHGLTLLRKKSGTVLK